MSHAPLRCILVLLLLAAAAGSACVTSQVEFFPIKYTYTVTPDKPVYLPGDKITLDVEVWVDTYHPDYNPQDAFLIYFQDSQHQVGSLSEKSVLISRSNVGDLTIDGNNQKAVFTMEFNVVGKFTIFHRDLRVYKLTDSTNPRARPIGSGQNSYWRSARSYIFLQSQSWKEEPIEFNEEPDFN